MPKTILKKLKNYEFWPYQILYAPFIPLWLWYSCKSKSLTYCTLVNPEIRNGGLLNYNKEKILESVPEEFKPKSKTIYKAEHPCFDYPFIAKPEYGARGENVELIRNKEDWKNYLNMTNFPIVLQEYIDFPIEFGVFYYRYPNEPKGEILGITGKKFLRVNGDGKSTLEELVQKNKRANKRYNYLRQKFHKDWNRIIEKDESLLLEEIGNHNRGTEFFDASDLISEELKKRIDEIAQNIPEYHYGRWDIKSTSRDAFKKGQFVIIEINGTNSEATHIYDTRYSLYDAYSIVNKKLNIQYKIAKQNKKRGFDSVSSFQLLKEIWKEICSPKS